MRYPVKTEIAILLTLLKIQERHKKTYSNVSLVGIQKKLKRFYGLGRTRSDISYHLGKFYRTDILRYWQQSKQAEDGTWHLIPSNRSLSGKGIALLKRYGFKVSNMLYNWAFRGIKPFRSQTLKGRPKPSNIITMQPRRSASPAETLKNILPDTLNSLK